MILLASARFRPGHPEGYALAFANIYRDYATARMLLDLGEQSQADAALDRVPTVDDGRHVLARDRALGVRAGAHAAIRPLARQLERDREDLARAAVDRDLDPVERRVRERVLRDLPAIRLAVPFEARPDLGAINVVDCRWTQPIRGRNLRERDCAALLRSVCAQRLRGKF